MEMSDLRALEEALSLPAPADVAALGTLAGDLLILGVSGKMGPSLARLARRASDEAGVRRRVIGVARFSASGVRDQLERAGIETVAADLLARDALTRLPDAPNVVYLAGQKFGTSGDQPRTWATNVLAASLAAERFADSRIVAFSTGNVYPLTPVAGGGSRETDPVGPVGEYAQSALGRERVLEYWSRCNGTPMAILRLNYAIEPRYGVLRDIADRLVRGEPVDLAMGYVNVIWQRDASAAALRAFAHTASPPLVLNLTGTATLAVRDLAQRLGESLGVAPRFTGTEQDTALLSNAARCTELFGEPPVSLEEMVSQVAGWVKAGGSGLGKPTHFQEREGRF
jgi:nucleoside-diphosphate-sugar epimerase